MAGDRAEGIGQNKRNKQNAMGFPKRRSPQVSESRKDLLEKGDERVLEWGLRDGVILVSIY